MQAGKQRTLVDIWQCTRIIFALDSDYESVQIKWQRNTAPIYLGFCNIRVRTGRVFLHAILTRGKFHQQEALEWVFIYLIWIRRRLSRSSQQTERDDFEVHEIFRIRVKWLKFVLESRREETIFGGDSTFRRFIQTRKSVFNCYIGISLSVVCMSRTRTDGWNHQNQLDLSILTFWKCIN